MRSELLFARSPFSMPQLYVGLIANLNDHSLRNMKLPEVDALVEHLDFYRPSLKADIKNLTSLLLLLIEDHCLLDQRLQLKMLTESQIASREHAARSLKELFEFSNNCSSFLTEAARSNLSQPNTEASTYPLVSFGEQAGGSTASPGPYILDADDPSITSCTGYLLSPTNWEEMDRFGEDFFLIST
jgi:hypothetical protein